MKNKWLRLMFVAVIVILLVACNSNSKDVASLDSGNSQQGEPTAVVEEEPLGDEEKMMAFTQCMRDEGIELVEVGVDADGNVQRPQLADGSQVSREEFGKGMEVCGIHLEGLTMGEKREDKSEIVDKMLALATCLREKGYDMDDPTAETLDQWQQDFRVEFDWDDPEAKAAYDECSDAD